MTIDAIRSTDPRDDRDEIDSPPARATAKTQAPHQSAEQLQALFIESEPVEKMTDGFQSWISHMKKLADKDPP